MATKAVVSGGEVVNLIVIDETSDYVPPEGAVLIDVGDAVVSIGDSYADGVFVRQERAD